jgi:hypothetical protein
MYLQHLWLPVAITMTGIAIADSGQNDAWTANVVWAAIQHRYHLHLVAWVGAMMMRDNPVVAK